MDISVGIEKHLRVLKELGITGINAEMEAIAQRSLITRTEEAAEVWDIATTILSYAGMGRFDSSMRRWRPSSDSVYSFDAEALEPRKMYTFFLQGISSINQNEFSLSDLREYEAIDGEAHKIFFRYNGRPYEFVSSCSGDWFDLHILNFINAILEEEKKPKRFFFLVSGCQMVVIFYNTAEWADTFTERLGYPLYCTVDF
ncbi:MAG: hypothetical protein ACLSVG_09220 [Clostridia bacterium]